MVMRHYIKKIANIILRRQKVDEKNSTEGGKNKVIRIPLDINIDDREIIKVCLPYTMTSVTRLEALISAVEYVSRNNIAGGFVECGVWRGGSSLAAALKFSELGDYRDIFMFDTFEGMTSPTEADVDLKGKKAEVLLNMEDKND